MPDETKPAGGGTSTTTPAKGEEFKAMSAEQFAARLEHERAAGAKSVLAQLGVEKPEDAKGRIARAKELEDAQLSETQRYQKQLDELKPQAARAKQLEDSIREALEAEEKLIPEALRDRLELAPADPGARLAWLTKAKGKGMFTPPAADGAPAAPKPANTRAGTTPPAARAEPAVKSVKDMSPAEYAAHKRRVLSGQV